MSREVLPENRSRAAARILAPVLIAATCLTGCATARLDVRTVRQALDVRLDPPTSRIEATSTRLPTMHTKPC